uniref:Right handed beta helix domain-containing protein n=1 Tax=Neobodo designis TaxID=312471 RepID=A0A7S1PL20_NEODS
MADDERDEEMRPEEEEEEEDEEAWAEPVSLEGLPVGNTTTFVGGFSTVKNLSDALAAWKNKDDRIIVLPGTYDADVSLDANGHQGLVLQGDATAEPSAIVFKGLLDVAATAGAKPPGSDAMPAEEEEAEDEDGENAAAKQPPRPLTLGRMAFLGGAVFSETADADINECVFGSAFVDDAHERVPRTVRCHGLSTVRVNKCTCYGMERSAVYCYPHARATFTDCTFVGAKKPPPPPPEHERRRRRLVAAPPPPPSVPESCECEVGVHMDDSQAKFVGCVVNNFTIGFAFNDKCAGTTVENCTVTEIATVAFLLGSGTCPAVRGNSAKLCGRECVVVGGKAHPTMRNNVFVGDARLKDGAVVTGICDNVLGLNGQLIAEGQRYTVKGFTSVPKDPTLVKPKKPEDEDEE